MKTTMPLARFISRHAMVYERTYPHPIDLVWDAVSTAEHLDVWLLPVTSVDRRVGGRCSFTWGGPGKPEQVGEVTTFDPPKEIQYTFGHPESFLRFQLASVAMGTRLTFTHSFEPGAHTTPVEESDTFGADLPAGPDAPWRPGFVAGFHSMIDNLERYLAGGLHADEVDASLARYRASGPAPDELDLQEAYRRRIREHCPPA